jgi:hypothetical protein
MTYEFKITDQAKPRSLLVATDTKTHVEVKSYRILSLGAGVQSTAIALLIKDGRLPAIDCAVFADTQEEPQGVYRHLEWLKKECAGAFEIVTRTQGSLGIELVRGRRSEGKHYVSIPCFTLNGEEDRGMRPRQCTMDYKTNVIERFVRREVLGLKKGQRIPKDVDATQIIGLSFDEPSRVARVRAVFASHRAFRPQFPLFDLMWTRDDCVQYLLNRVPHKVERSACVFCPYKSDGEWARLKAEDSHGWSRAVEIDMAIRNPASTCTKNLRGVQFLHRSCKPLSEVVFKPRLHHQTTMSFANECEGMCGL